MSHQSRGLAWEKEVSKALYRNTGETIRVYPAGYSGNQATPSTDILVTDGINVHAIELKKHTKPRDPPKETDRRAYVADDEDFEQLCDLPNEYTKIYLGVKFDHCELLLLGPYVEHNPRVLASKMAEDAPQCFDPHVTKSGSLRLSKPRDTNVWPSATSGEADHVALANYLDIPIVSNDE